MGKGRKVKAAHRYSPTCKRAKPLAYVMRDTRLPFSTDVSVLACAMVGMALRGFGSELQRQAWRDRVVAVARGDFHMGGAALAYASAVLRARFLGPRL